MWLIVGFKEFEIRAVRDDIKQLKWKCPMTVSEISLTGGQRTEEAMCARMAGRGFSEKGTLCQNLENE